MKYVYFDIASHTAVFALIENENVVAYKEYDQRIGDHELLPCIEDVLKTANWSYQDLTNIACVIGPGGFTSLRVAVSCANTLASQLQIPLAGIHLSTIFKARQDTKDTAVWLHSTKRDQFFVCDFGDAYPKPICVVVDDFCKDTEYVSKCSGWMGELIDDHASKIQLPQLSLNDTKNSIAQVVRSADYSQSILAPWYGRDG